MKDGMHAIADIVEAAVRGNLIKQESQIATLVYHEFAHWLIMNRPKLWGMVSGLEA